MEAEVGTGARVLSAEWEMPWDVNRLASSRLFLRKKVPGAGIDPATASS